MQQFLTSRFTLLMAAFGAGLALLLNLISGAGIAALLIRTLVSALILAVVAFLIQWLIDRFIPREHLDILFKGSSDSLPGQTENETGSRLDVTDDSALSPEELYSAGADNDSDDEPVTRSSFSTPRASDSELLDTPPDFNRSAASPQDSDSSSDSFQETDFSQSPRVQPAREEMSETGFSSSETDASAPASSSFSDGDVKLPPMQPQAESTGQRDVSFKVDNKKISADPKLIAKAIKTVLSRDS